MNKIKYLLLFLFPLVFCSSFESYLDNGIGIKSISMGEAYYHQSNAESAYYNPALISKADRSQVQLVFNQKWENMEELYLSVLYPMDQFNMVLTYFNSHLNNGIQGVAYDPNTNQNTLTGENYSYYASLVMLSFAKDIDNKLALGFNVKNFIKDLSVAKASSYAVDLGANYKINDKMNASIKINNLLSTEYQWETEKEKPQIGINAGIGLQVPGNINLNIGIKNEQNNVSILAGLEGNISHTLYYRGGFNKDIVSLGLGLNIEDISFDYSYSYYLSGEDYLSAIHRFGLTYEFGNDEKSVNEIAVPINNQSIINSVDDIELNYVLIFDDESSSGKELIPNQELIINEETTASITSEIASMRVKLAGRKVIISGTADKAKAIYLCNKEVFIRPDKKFYISEPYISGGVPLIIIANDGQRTNMILNRNSNKLLIKGSTQLDKQPIYVNDNVVFRRADGAFYDKIEFPDQVDFVLKIKN